MKIVVGDLEANGLLDTVTEIWCGSFADSETGEVVTLQGKEAICNYLDTVDVLIMHNGICYDIPLLKKVYNYEFKGQLIDTLVMSRVLWPDRPWGHSVDKWGKHLGMQKVENDEWLVFAPIILERCRVDVLIQLEIWKRLKGEMDKHVKFTDNVKYS